MPVLTAKGLTKSFGPRVILDGVDLAIERGERVGLVGINGGGKSTLARIVAGAMEPDAGEVVPRRDAVIEYLAQEPRFDPDLTAEQVVRSGLELWVAARDRHAAISARLGEAAGEAGADLEGLLAEQAEAAAEVERLGGWDRDHVVVSTLTHLGVPDPAQRFGDMSGGEKRRTALARLLVREPDLAILDEPTNHLDTETIEWLEQDLSSRYRGALLLITHDRYVLDRVVTRTFEIDRGQLYTYAGGWSAYLEAKAERQALQARTEANRQKFVQQELEWLRRSPSARTTKQKARVQRAEAAASERGPGSDRTAALQLETTRLGKTILELRELVVDVAGRRLVDGLELQLQRGDRVGIVGPNGAGKTSLLRVVTGELEPAGGEVVIGKNTRFTYFDQARRGLENEATVWENVAGQREKLQVGDRAMDVRSYMARFLFAPERLREKVGALSGGERARVLLAKLLLQPANVLLLDEPTNDLDVATLGALEEMILEANVTALIVSHDRYFLDRVATSILDFEGEGRVVRYVGNYDVFRRLKQQRRAAAASEAAEVAKAAAAKAAPAKKKAGLSWKEKRELEGMVEAIEVAEAKLEELDAVLADPATYAERGDEVPALTAERDAAAAAVEQLMERWEALEAKRD